MSSLKVSDGHCWQIVGDLTFATVMSCYKIAQRERIKLSSDWEICFGNDHCNIDSAGLSFMIDNVIYAETTGIKLKFINFKSERLMSLAEIYGVDEMIKSVIER
ncbi:MAG: STAS domain-containing protein [Francisellaceae bacterium]